MSNGEATIIKAKDITTLTYSLPESWTKAAGLLKSKNKALQAHLKKVRKEWSK